jgi:NAD+ kinase
VEKAISFFRTEGIEVIPLKRAKLKSIGRADLVITIGGDGTFLDTAHFVKDIPMWGINSTPTHSAGFLMSATPQNFEQRWRLLVQGKLPVLKLQRLQVLVNGRKIPELVLNDVLIAHANPAAVSRYELRVSDRKEEQKSSGLWISTAAGSTAAIQSAGGKILPLESKQIQFIARELYHGRHHRYRLAKGIVSQKTKIQAISQMHEAGCYFDGPRVWYPIRYGDRITVKVASQSLQVIGPIR